MRVDLERKDHEPIDWAVMREWERTDAECAEGFRQLAREAVPPRRTIFVGTVEIAGVVFYAS